MSAEEKQSETRRPPPPPPPSSPPPRPARPLPPPPPPPSLSMNTTPRPSPQNVTSEDTSDKGATTDILAHQREIMMKRRQEDMRAEAVRSVESASSSSSPSYYTPAIKQFSTPRAIEEETFSSFGISSSSSSSTKSGGVAKEEKDGAPTGNKNNHDMRVVPLPLGPPPSASSRLNSYRASLSSSSSFRDESGAAEPKGETKQVPPPLPSIAKEEEEEEEDEEDEEDQEEEQAKGATHDKRSQRQEEEEGINDNDDDADNGDGNEALYNKPSTLADALAHYNQASRSCSSSASSSFSASLTGRQHLDLETLLATRSSIHKFVRHPVPHTAGVVQCYIKRRKASGPTKLYPEYYLYTREGDHFLMAAKKQSNNKTSNYHITLNDRDFAKESPDYLGKLRANFVGTEFQLFDRGVSAKDASVESTALIPPHAGRSREELAIIVYAANVLGSRGPRKMQVFLPRVNKKDDTMSHWKDPEDLVRDDAMLERVRRGDIFKFHHLINKPPRWSDQLGAYVLNFNGRVTMASVKNFQLIDPEDHETVVLQFGRVGHHDFTMDVRWPFSPLQAFAITLSSFDSKIACD